MTSFPIPGVRLGHVTGARTGVTVLLFPSGSVGSGEVRGGAPASREIDLLEPARAVTRVDSVVFAGGSAFGLSTADGVMQYLAERGQGYPTAGGVVPIVPTACIFDLAEADDPPPGPAEGYAAAVAAACDERSPTGRIGVGAGATVGKWKGREYAAPSGLGVAHADVEGVRVAALAVVNAVGDVIGADGSMVAGSAAPPDRVAFPTPAPFEETAANTTLVAVVTDALLDKAACLLLAHSAHDGFARALHPVHTRYDGDLAVVVATGSAPPSADPSLDRLRIAATTVTADAIRAAPR